MPLFKWPFYILQNFYHNDCDFGQSQQTNPTFYNIFGNKSNLFRCLYYIEHGARA